jgi:hypothetical protein
MRKLIVALGIALALAGCGSQPTNENVRDQVFDIKVNGTRCIILADYDVGGIDCDFEGSR